MNKRIIYTELLKLGGGVHKKGFELIIAAAEKLCKNPNIKTMTLYYDLANEFNDTKDRVERAIRYYIEGIFANGNENEVRKFNMKLGKTGVPTCTEFLKSFVLYLRMNYVNMF